MYLKGPLMILGQEQQKTSGVVTPPHLSSIHSPS